MKTVLITGARAPIALDLARSFQAAGWTPHLADSITPWAARFAKVARGHLHRLPPPRFAFPAFAEALARLATELDPALILPTCEEVFYVAEAARRGFYAERVFAPSPEVLRALHSKVEFAGLARRAGVPAPETRRATSSAELDPWRAQAGALVFKPEFSRFASHALVRPMVEALARVAPTAVQPWAVQDFAAGEELCVWSAARAGRLVAFAAYRPLWRLGRSASFYFERVDDPALQAMAAAIARATGATGQLSYDVIRGPDGSVMPIECNPRGVSGLHLFDGDPALARALAGELDGVLTPRAAARHLGPAMAVIGLPAALASGRLATWRRDLARSRDVLSVDPLTGLGALLDAGRFAMVGLSRGRSASGASTDDIEWNGEPIG